LMMSAMSSRASSVGSENGASRSRKHWGSSGGKISASSVV